MAFRQYHDRQIHFDQVTGLPNERLFENAIDELIGQLPLRKGLLALFSIAVPECRQLRETVGRGAADGLAMVVARRLERLAAASAATSEFSAAADRRYRVARLGEQHFGLVIEGLANTDAVEATAKTILATLAEPVPLGLHESSPVPWLGIALAPGDGATASELRQSADLASTHGQRRGTAQFAFASAELNAKSVERLTLGAQLRGAAMRGELRLHYQPKVALDTGRIVGVEALLRWQHPEHGLIPPLKFIPLAEELGLMTTIGQWVIEHACHDAAGWAERGLGEIKVAINVSKPQFVTGNLVAEVRQAMFDSGLPARQLVIELTESMLMDDVSQAIALMHDLKALGVTLSIDDFGTGYSSLSYLKKFPLDELKIDRSFVIDLP
ncbi:MAG: EAL domain-containing protein, partial [Caldimonas sp.]